MTGADLLAAFNPPFEVRLPAWQSLPVVLNSPHSGQIYPRLFREMSQLDADLLRCSEDSFTDDLFAPLVPRGCALLKARFPRAFLDVNREPYELDPAMFDEALPAFVNAASQRVAGGLGTVPRIVSRHLKIYDAPLAWDEVKQRIDRLYFPYHKCLGDLVEDTYRRFGRAVLIDCHSMPSAVGDPFGGARPDVILGDRYGCACAPALSAALESAFTGEGFKVVRNNPYAGGFITQTYGRPGEDIHAIQIEINRGLYMDELRFQKKPGFARIARMIEAALTGFFNDLPDLLGAPATLSALGPLAAE